MKLRPDQLVQQLKKGLQPIYFICGDEPLQVMESADAIRRAAREQEYTEREVLDVSNNFDWSLFLDAGNSMSLFAEKRILELRMPSPKPGKQGSVALVDYAQRPADDTVLIITTGKLEGATKNSKWFKSLDQAGAIIQCWPIATQELPRWIGQRMQLKGMRPSVDAIALLADRIEGNLLAAVQEIDKLYLLFGESDIGLEQVTESVADSSRYSIYDLVDSALGGHSVRTAKIIGGLKNESVEPVLALWALSREVRNLAFISEAGMTPDAAMMKLRVWENRKPLMRKALARHTPARWKLFLKRCAKIDKVIKGVEQGRPWDELLMLSTQIAR
ncbi:MAG: DNA polymerase III subunit delta [Gammaproteobacteria bacterium]|nr:DNA polymerase III subunit delta [Gammaproteobacteria bacterium]